jgi:hypothetical protein
LAAVIFSTMLSGCASSRVRSKQIYTGMDFKQKADLLEERTGLALTDSEISLRVVESAPSELANYSQTRDVIPGEGAASLFTKEEVLPGDFLVGINDRAVTPDLNIPAYLNSLEDKAWLTFFSPGARKTKLYIVRDKELLSRIVFSSQAVQVNAVRVGGVVPGSWADRQGFKSGDWLLQGFLADGDGYKYLVLSLLPAYKSSAQREKLVFDNASKAVEVFLKVFADKQSLLGTDKVSLQKETLLNLALVSGQRFETKKIYRMRFLGLGVEFDCPAEKRCGKAQAQIFTVYPDSESGRAGFLVNDLVEEIDGEKINSSWEAIRKIRSMPLDREMNFKVRRGMKLMELKAAKGLVVVE